MEHSQRGKDMTHKVSVWIENDFQFNPTAVSLAHHVGCGALRHYLSVILKAAAPYSAAWQTAQDMAPNDYDRVDWQEIFDTLTGK